MKTPKPKPRRTPDADADEMTMRDIFAAFTIAGLHANPAPEIKGLSPGDIAEIAYVQADMLLEIRKETL